MSETKWGIPPSNHLPSRPDSDNVIEAEVEPQTLPERRQQPQVVLEHGSDQAAIRNMDRSIESMLAQQSMLDSGNIPEMKPADLYALRIRTATAIARLEKDRAAILQVHDELITRTFLRVLAVECRKMISSLVEKARRIGHRQCKDDEKKRRTWDKFVEEALLEYQQRLERIVLLAHQIDTPPDYGESAVPKQGNGHDAEEAAD